MRLARYGAAGCLPFCAVHHVRSPPVPEHPGCLAAAGRACLLSRLPRPSHFSA